MYVDKGEYFSRVISPFNGLYIKILYSVDGRLSMTGVCSGKGGTGQISKRLMDYLVLKRPISDGFTEQDVVRIFDIWNRWHLNDMRAGTQKQMDYLRKRFGTTHYNHDKMVDALKEVNLYIDNGYRYGTAWLVEEVPESIIKYLFSLPAVTGDSWKDIHAQEVDAVELFNIISQKG